MKSYLKWGILIVVSGFFLAAGVLKLVDPGEFAHSILRYQLMSGGWVWMAALWVPWLEVVGAVGLWLRGWRGSAIVLLVVLLLVFEVALASAALRGLDIDCGCLGRIDGTGVGFALVRNLVLIGALLVLPKLEPSRK